MALFKRFEASAISPFYSLKSHTQNLDMPMTNGAFRPFLIHNKSPVYTVHPSEEKSMSMELPISDDKPDIIDSALFAVPWIRLFPE